MNTPSERLRYRSPLELETVFQHISAAAVVALLNIATAVSLGTLVFSDTLAPAVSIGIGVYLIGMAVSGFLVPAFSGYNAIVAGPRGGQSPIFAAMAASIATVMVGAPLDVVVVTVVASMLTTTVIVGIFMYAVGAADMGSLARYIPFPVIGGFFAGLGYLVARGGVMVSVGPIVDPTSFPTFLTAEALLHMVPAVLFGVVLFWLDRRISHWLLVPTFLAAAIGLFFFALVATGTSIETATESGWFTRFDASTNDFFPIMTLDQIHSIDWGVIAQHYDKILVLCVLSVIMLLLDVSGVEIIIDRDLDPNRELRTAGLANVAGAGATGILGMGSAADTAVAHKLGGKSFLLIALRFAIIAAVIIAGPSSIALVPVPIVGGFLIYIGLSFLIKWVWSRRSKLPLVDIVVIVIILAAVACYGILEGVAVGVLLATVLFVHKYSQLSVIKSAINATEHVSNIDRHKDEQAFLDENGFRVHIFVLQGFLFFGSANRLLDRIKEVVDRGDSAKARYLLMDFSRVDEMDSSAANSLSKLMQICARKNITLCLTGDKQDVLRRLVDLGSDLDLPEGVVRVFQNLDDAAGWADDKLLNDYADRIPFDEVIDSGALLIDLLGNAQAADTIAAYFEELCIEEGEVLFEQDAFGDSLFLILGGAISIVFALPDRAPLTVRTMRAGSILGEMAVYTGAPRSASAVARRDSVLFRLSIKNYNKLVQNQPLEAELFSSCIVKLMAERLARSNKSVVALSR